MKGRIFARNLARVLAKISAQITPCANLNLAQILSFGKGLFLGAKNVLGLKIRFNSKADFWASFRALESFEILAFKLKNLKTFSNLKSSVSSFKNLQSSRLKNVNSKTLRHEKGLNFLLLERIYFEARARRDD